LLLPVISPAHPHMKLVVLVFGSFYNVISLFIKILVLISLLLSLLMMFKISSMNRIRRVFFFMSKVWRILLATVVIGLCLTVFTKRVYVLSVLPAQTIIGWPGEICR